MTNSFLHLCFLFSIFNQFAVQVLRQANKSTLKKKKKAALVKINWGTFIPIFLE